MANGWHVEYVELPNTKPFEEFVKKYKKPSNCESYISRGQTMTNYEKLLQDQMKDPQFAKAYLDARLERLLIEFLENLKEKISQNEPKEALLRTIDSMQEQIYSLQF
jgi:hypothetical protein